MLHEWFDLVWNQGSTDAVHRLLAPGAVMHNLAQDGKDSYGAEEFLAFFHKFRDAFPDIHVTMHETVTQGDLQAGRWTVIATHTGDTLGLAPTRRKVTLDGMSLVRLANGRAVEAWNIWDAAALNTQLGFTLTPPATNQV